MTQHDDFDEARRKAARASLEAAAAHSDPRQAAILQMCADDLTRELTDEEREAFREAGLDV